MIKIKRAAAAALSAAMLLNIGCSAPAEGFESDARVEADSSESIDEEADPTYGALFSPGAGCVSYAMAYAEAFAKYLSNNDFCLYIEDELVQRRAMELIDGVIGGECGGGALAVAQDDEAGGDESKELIEFVGEYDPDLLDKFNREWELILSGAGEAADEQRIAIFSPGAYSKAYAQGIASAYAAFLCSNTVNVYVNGKPTITAEPEKAEPRQDSAQTLESLKRELPTDPDYSLKSIFSPGSSSREYSAALARATASFFSGNTINVYLDGTKNPNAPTPEYVIAMLHSKSEKTAKLRGASAFTVTAGGFEADKQMALTAVSGLIIALNDDGIETRVCSLDSDDGAQAVIAVGEKDAEAALGVFAAYSEECTADILPFVPNFAFSMEPVEQAPKRALSAEASAQAANLAYVLFSGAANAVYTQVGATIADGEMEFTTVVGANTQTKLDDAEKLLKAQASLAGFETSFG